MLHINLIIFDLDEVVGLEPDALNAEGVYQSESVEQRAFTDRLRPNQIDPVPVKAELKSVK